MQSLLDAIRENPDDDEPRLVYADWLSDRGDPRGEFIVRQLRGDEVAPREEWSAHLPAWSTAHTFRRGFIDTVTFGKINDVFAAPQFLLHPGPVPIIRLGQYTTMQVSLDGQIGLWIDRPVLDELAADWHIRIVDLPKALIYAERRMRSREAAHVTLAKRDRVVTIHHDDGTTSTITGW